MKVAVLGATGYTGMILLRLLDKHPQIEQIYPASSSKEGELVSSNDPGLVVHQPERWQACEGRYLSVETIKNFKPDVIFAALPHLESTKLCEPFIGPSVVIDLSADFRHQDRARFERAYGHPPPREDLLKQAVYGLAEWNTEQIQKADLIANPGCYPTSALLPLLPLYKHRVIIGNPIINSLSGISGAGKKNQTNLLFTERQENAGAYSPARQHRHSHEIEEQLGFVQNGTTVLFQPHMVPMKRGMASTIAVRLAPGKTAEEVEQALLTTYHGRPFVRLVKHIPQTLDVWNTNRCDIGYTIEQEHLLIFSVIDNLVKGASGQAIQNMNLRFGLEETAGLEISNCI